LIRSQARKRLKNLSGPERYGTAEEIVPLERNPDGETLDIKKLEDEPYFRLRIGNWSVIFEIRRDIFRIIAVEKTKPCGHAY
jgi:mRNA interferase RelE/StbE